MPGVTLRLEELKAAFGKFAREGDASKDGAFDQNEAGEGLGSLFSFPESFSPPPGFPPPSDTQPWQDS